MGNMCLPVRNDDDTPFEMIEHIRDSQIGSSDPGRLSVATSERFGSIVEGRASRNPSIIDTKYKSLADMKERLQIDVVNSKN